MKKILFASTLFLSADSKKAPTPLALIAELNFLESLINDHEITKKQVTIVEDSDLILFNSEEFDTELKTRQQERMEWWNVNAASVFEQELASIGDNLLT